MPKSQVVMVMVDRPENLRYRAWLSRTGRVSHNRPIKTQLRRAAGCLRGSRPGRAKLGAHVAHNIECRVADMPLRQLRRRARLLGKPVVDARRVLDRPEVA